MEDDWESDRIDYIGYLDEAMENIQGVVAWSRSLSCELSEDLQPLSFVRVKMDLRNFGIFRLRLVSQEL